MVKELYQTILRETSLNVTSGEIDSIRKKSITKSGCRVYDGSYLGVSGVLGEPTPEAWTQAEANLSRRIPCPWGPETGKRRTCRRGTAMDASRFLQLAEELLKKGENIDKFLPMMSNEKIFEIAKKALGED